MKLRPFTGRLATAISPTVELTCDRVVSITGAAPLTVTDSAMFDGVSSMRVLSVWPTVSATFFSSNGLKPDRFAFTV